MFAEFDDDNGQRSPRFTTSVHEVLGVVDAHSRRLLPFTEAVRRRIIDPVTGDYHDRVKGRLIYSSDAIRQGLIRTKLLNQFDGQSAAWLVPTSSPVLPVELGTMARVDLMRADSVFLPGELGPWSATTAGSPSLSSSSSSPRNVRTSISGWILDL